MDHEWRQQIRAVVCDLRAPAPYVELVPVLTLYSGKGAAWRFRIPIR